jgi:hypothetical protein
MRRPLAPLLVLLAAGAGAGAGACGGTDQEARMRLSTPPERPGAEPLPEIRAQQEQAERDAEQAARDAAVRPTAADARRLTPVIRGWANAVRRNQHARATAYFTVPAIVAQGVAIRLTTAAGVRRFNSELPCGAKLVAVTHEGRYLIGRFRLTQRPDHVCTTPGAMVRVAFFMRARKIAEWRQVPNTPGAPPGPDAPENSAPPQPQPIS